MRTSQKFYLPFKRFIGLIGSIVGIVFCFILLWWWVIPIDAIVTRGHPFFARHRIGQNGKPFRLIKFRSMSLDANPHMTSRDDGAYDKITRFGKFLRITSIDETPQLINILIGQMSFIGPRPLIDVSNDKITTDRRKELGVEMIKPGISGWAQIHNRADLDPIKKADLDYYYLKHFSFLFDTKIFFFTIFRIFGKGKGK